MHYVCFHFEFEHQGDPDIECAAGGCPAAGIRVPARYLRTEGVDLVAAADTVIPAILALEDNGFTVTQEANLIVAKSGQYSIRGRGSGDGPGPGEARRDASALASRRPGDR
jgi:hypothetical protein